MSSAPSPAASGPQRHDSFALLRALAARGVTALAGVPCSSMTGLINAAQSRLVVPYANAPNEGEALAYGAGVWLGGGLAAVLCQNSGLGNLYNCLTSLNLPYAIPGAILCGWRGMPDVRDEPQHRVMGAVTPDLFGGIGIAPRILTTGSSLAAAVEGLSPAARRTVAILVAPGALAEAEAEPVWAAGAAPGALVRRPGQPVLDRAGAVRLVAGIAGDGVAVIASTGLLSREYSATADGDNLFSMAGSMGHAASLGLGAAAQSGVPVLVVDGDGSIMMRPQAMLFVGSEAPAAFCHFVVDNGAHESTGGQPTLSATADLAAAAIAFGYRRAVDTTDPAEAAEAAEVGLAGGGPVFVRLRIRPGGTVPPRIGLAFPEMAGRFRRFLVRRGSGGAGIAG
jgi:phosphonopyruvate decarboxylase